MYQVLSKDIICMDILPHLSVAKRCYPTKSELVEIVNAILYKLKTGIQWEYLPGLEKANISVDGLFINADGGFAAKIFRNKCLKHGIMANVDFNSRNGDVHDNYLLDEMLYKERYSIERTNAWMDSFRTLLNRFDTTVSSWKSFNYIAFMVILLKKIEKRKKFR
ncbi:Transposase DDE domain [Popillia japonica]|uniref:Transposase DDE domain n=1 Tax=Popillia japonica TaxID=7064 RepID=A0AAW1HEV1_POPJA